MLTIDTKKAACQGEIADFPKNALHSCSLCLRIAHGSVNKNIASKLLALNILSIYKHPAGCPTKRFCDARNALLDNNGGVQQMSSNLALMSMNLPKAWNAH